MEKAGIFTSYTRRLLQTSMRQRSLGRSASAHDRKDVLFSKYVSHRADDVGIETVSAWVLTAPLPFWRRALFALGLSWPSEGSDHWERVEVLAVWTDMRTDGGTVRERLVNPFDCDQQLTVFVKPFVQLYQVRGPPPPRRATR